MLRASLIFIFLFAGSAFAQPDSLWSRFYGGPYTDECWSVVKTSDGGYALGGVFDGHLRDIDDEFYLVKTDEEGFEQWSFIHGTEGNDVCLGILQTEDNGFLMVGWSISIHGQGAYVVRIDSTGEIVWVNLYESGYHFNSVIETDDECFLLVGEANHAWDMYVMKINQDGEEIWSNSYGGGGAEEVFSILPSDDGGYLLAGYTTSRGARGRDMYVVKIDEEGNEEWSQTYGTELAEWCYEAVKTPDAAMLWAVVSRGRVCMPTTPY